MNSKKYSAEIMAQPCPKEDGGCGQKPLQRCVSLQGGIAFSNPHAARRKLAEKATNESAPPGNAGA